MSASSGPTTSLRPSELILDYLEKAAFADPSAKEVRLPTIRQVAQRLEVGVSTVGAVYRTLAEQGRIRTEVGNGSFLLPAPRKEKSAELRVGIGIPSEELKDPAGWYSRVYGGIAFAALRAGQPITILPLDLGKLSPQIETLHAVIIMQGRLLQSALVEAAQRVHIPAVFFNPPRLGETENFVSADFAGASETLGRAFETGGRKDVVMLLSDPWHLSISAHYRMSGLLTGLKFGTPNGVHVRIEFADGYEVENGRRAMRQILESAPRCPDAIYTSGDFLAIGCLEELAARGIDSPREVSVVGGSGLNLERYPYPALTCCAQPYDQIGAEIIDMILRLLETKSHKLPGRVIPMGWVGGATTLPEENQVLMP
ncbi:hypothetical protein BH09VER1_BH09VER1_16960 [soil metagenome]